MYVHYMSYIQLIKCIFQNYEMLPGAEVDKVLVLDYLRPEPCCLNTNTCLMYVFLDKTI